MGMSLCKGWATLVTLFSYSLPADTEYTLLVMAIKDKRNYTLLRVLMCTHVPCVLPNCDEYEAAQTVRNVTQSKLTHTPTHMHTHTRLFSER